MLDVPEFWDSNQGSNLLGCRSGVLNNDNCIVFTHFSSFTRVEMCKLIPRQSILSASGMNELIQNDYCANAILIAKRLNYEVARQVNLKKGVELETFVLIRLSTRGSRSIMIPSRPSQHRVIHSISPQTALLCQTNDLARV